MLRFAASLVVVPFALVLLLAVALDTQNGKLGSLTVETFELGMLPVVFLTAFALLAIFLPLLLLTSRYARLSPWNCVVVGLVSALLPVLVLAWPVLADSGLRLGFRAEHLAARYPLLAMGALGGFLFWLFAVFRNAESPLRKGPPSQPTKSAA